VIAAVQPSPTLTVHDTVSPCKGGRRSKRGTRTGDRHATASISEPRVPSNGAAGENGENGKWRVVCGGGPRTHGDDAAAVGEGVEPDGVTGGGAHPGRGDELERVPGEAAGQRRPPPHPLHPHRPHRRRRRHRRLTRTPPPQSGSIGRAMGAAGGSTRSRRICLVRGLTQAQSTQHLLGPPRHGAAGKYLIFGPAHLRIANGFGPRTDTGCVSY
jgi:hypothetical protein